MIKQPYNFFIFKDNMKLTLHNFGCFKDKVFDLKDKFILLEGPNGSGKSTVFRAICYALYGKNKTLRYGETTSSVEYEVKDFVVKRVSKPMSLKVTYKGKTYEDAEAQALIEHTLIGMPWEQFCLCTWIGSTSKASLASITPTERYNVIRTLVANTDETLEDCKKISEYEKMTQEDFLKVKSQQSTLEELSKDFAGVKSPQIKEVPKNLKTKIQKLERELEIYEDKYKKLCVLESKMSKKDIKKRLKDLDLYPQIVEKISQLKIFLAYAKRLEKQKNDSENFEQMKDEYFKSIEDDLKTQKALVEELDEEEIKARIKEHTVRCIAKDNQNPYWDLSVKEIQKRLKNSRKSKVTAQMKETKQTCPHCKKNVCIDGDSVVKYLKSFDKEKVNETTEDIECLEVLQDLKYDYDENVEEDEEALTKATLRIKECERILKNNILTAQLTRMNKATGCDVKKPEGYKKKYNVAYLEERIEDLTKELGGIKEEEDGEVDRLYDLLDDKDSEISEDLAEVEEVLEQIREKLSKLRKSEGAQYAIDQWNEIQEKITNLDRNLEKCKEAQKSINKTMQAVSVLKTKQKEAEILSMQNVIQSINTLASHYLGMFFDESISISISMVKKTRTNTKMSLEISALYKGNKYTDISDFSQGESIKINLAFILALNQLANAPFLLLDEFMSNLDRYVITEIYDALKTISHEVPIVVIDHLAIKGVFDSVLVFEE